MRDERMDLWIQQYEEAALGILMEEYAKAEGERLLQEFETASAQDDFEPMPEELKAKYHQLIDQAYKKKRQRSFFSGITKAASKVAVIALLVFGIASAAILSVDAWRVPVLNFILAESGDQAVVNVGYSNSALKKQFEAIVETVRNNVPPDYTFTETPDTDKMALLIKMENKEGKLLNVCVSQENAQMTLDTENAEVEEIDLNGHPAYLIIKDGLYIIWFDDVKGLVISVSAQDISPNEFWVLVNALAE